MAFISLVLTSPFTLLLVVAAAANVASASSLAEADDYFWLCALVCEAVELTELRVNVIFLALFLGI